MVINDMVNYFLEVTGLLFWVLSIPLIISYSMAYYFNDYSIGGILIGFISVLLCELIIIDINEKVQKCLKTT